MEKELSISEYEWTGPGPRSLEKLHSSFTKLMVNTRKIEKKIKLICVVSELTLLDNTNFITLITF